MLISDLHKKRSISFPDSTALSFHGNKVSYGQLETDIEQFARYLCHKGLKSGERVAIALPNCPEFICVYMGIVRAGGVAVPLNMLQAPQELLYIMSDSESKYIITNPAIGVQIGKVPNISLDLIVLSDDCLREIAAAPPAVFNKPDSEDICTFLYTSGTTGRPKAAMLTHNNFLSNVKSIDEAAGLDNNENFLTVLPMFHSFGWTVCVLFPLSIGCVITILDGLKPKEILHLLSEEGITLFCGVPSMFSVLLRTRQKVMFPKLKFAISGGDSISREVMEAFEENFNFPIYEGYGLSEAAPTVCINPLYGVRKIKSIGLPLPGVEVKITDENERELPPGEVGEILVRGSNVMKGYYKHEEENLRVLKNGWLHTGDLAYKDNDGYIFIVGRKKDLIITSGFNVYPREVEEAIEEHPKVVEAAVIGISHPSRGEIGRAYIVLQEDQVLDKKELFSFLKDRLTNYKIPEEFIFAEDLPRGPSGKILKRKLTEIQ